MADNEILEQQRKAREDFLQLKRMQQGEIAPEPKPSELAIEPKTFSEKAQNYWFHFKWHTIGIIFLVVVMTILTAQCMGREKYDYEAVLFAYNGCFDAQAEKIEEYLEKYGTDVNGDGVVNIGITNCTFTEGNDAQYQNTMMTKIQTQLIANKSAFIYIVDKKAYEFLQNSVEDGILQSDPLALDDEFYQSTETKEFGKLPEGLMLGLRRVKGTMFEEDEKAYSIYLESEKTVEKIKNK